MSWLNWFPLLTWPNYVLSYNSIYLVYVQRLEWIDFDSLFRINFNYLYSNVIPFIYTWKMVKDTPNHMIDNIIG